MGGWKFTIDFDGVDGFDDFGFLEGELLDEVVVSSGLVSRFGIMLGKDLNVG